MLKWILQTGLAVLTALALICAAGCDSGGGAGDSEYEDVTVAFTVTVRNAETAEPIEGAKVEFAVLGYYWDDWEYTTVYTDAAGQATITDTANRTIHFEGTVSCPGFTDEDIDPEDFDADAAVERFVYLPVAPLGAAAVEGVVAEDMAMSALLVPSSEYPTIQEAIDAAQPGERVSVLPGEYWENIDFHGKPIMVESAEGPEQTCIVGADNAFPAVSFVTGEGPDSVLQGFTVRGGSVGIQVRNSVPTLRGNIIASGLDCDNPLTYAWLTAGNSGLGEGTLPGISGPKVDEFISWLTAEPRRFVENIQRLGSTPRPPAAANATAPRSTPAAVVTWAGWSGFYSILALVGLLLLLAGLALGFEVARRRRAAQRQLNT